MTSEADSLFARYQQSGDPATLARVFDLTAPKLLLLAVHLTGDELGAEDLVQYTFLKVIERAERYDPARPFLPWASTILANEARQVWRKSQRDPERPRLLRDAPRDPHELAAEADTVEVLTEAIDRLEDSYRAVVRLKVVHGMKPGEIARVLSISPEVARTRLSRGLKMLRGALPASLAGSVLLFVSGRGLAQVREQVIERARQARLASTASVGAPLALWLGVALVALTALGGWWWSGGSRPDEQPESPDLVAARSPSAADATAASAIPPGPGFVETSSPGRTPLASAAPVAAAGDGPWRLSGTVRSRAGDPLEGAMVEVSVLHGCDVTRLGPIRTDAEGRYELDVDALRRLGDLGLVGASLLVEASADGHQPSPAEWIEELPEHAAEPARFERDLQLTPGPVLRASLCTQRGEPVRCAASARLVEQGAGRATAWEHFDAGAELVLPVLGAGPWRLEVRTSAGLLFRPIPDLPGDGNLGVLPLEEHGVVQGRFVVPGGHPVPHANFSLSRLDSLDPPVEKPAWRDGVLVLAGKAAGRSDADGRFRVAGLPAGRYRLRLDHGAIEPVEALLETGAAPGDILLDGQSLTVRTVDDEGRLIPGLTLRFEWELGGRSRWGRLDINDQGGVFDLLVPFGSRWRFSSGTWRVGFATVEHVAYPHEPSAVLTIPIGGGAPTGRLAFELRDQAGRELEEYEVELEHHETGSFAPTIPGGKLAEQPLPVGGYTATLRCPAGLADPAVAFLPVVVRVEIEAEATCRREVEVRLGGLVEVWLEGPSEMISREDLYLLEETGEGLWMPAGGLVPPPHRPGRSPTVAAGRRLLRGVAVFEEGEHRFVVSSVGEDSTEASCVVLPGRTARFEASFGSR